MAPPFWLYQWLDEFRIKDVADLERSLAEGRRLGRLLKLAEASSPVPADESEQLERAILAGRGFDLSMTLECGSDSCRQGQVNELFRRVWHYFDSIILTDIVAPQVRSGSASREHVRATARSVGAALLFIRTLGGESLVRFREKPALSPSWSQDAPTAGLANVVSSWDALVEALVAESNFQIEVQADGTVNCTFVHPELSYELIAQYDSDVLKTSTVTELRQAAAKEMLTENAALLTSDVLAAARVDVPLAIGVPFHGRLLKNRSAGSTGDVLLELQLPVLDGVPVRDLLELRKYERESFERFRTALATAASEQRRLAPGVKAEVLAGQIRRDIIEPRLADIKHRLRLAESTLGKKAFFGISLGALATTCGVLLAAPPLAIGGAIAAIGAAAAAESKFLDDKKDVRLSDMYFLWDATKHAE